MDAKLKRKWIKALRSGEYDQTQGALCDGGTSFCCLGVLVNIQGSYWHENDDGEWFPITPSGKPQRGNLYPSRPWAAGVPKDAQVKLSNMNDGAGHEQRPHTFAEIADWIEANIRPRTSR